MCTKTAAMKKNCILFLLIAFTCMAELQAQTTWPGKEWPQVSPKEVGLNADTLAALDAVLASSKYGYVDGMLVIRHGKVAYSKVYKHDYKKLYGELAKKAGGLNGSDPTGPYNYYNAWWHPWYHNTDLHTLQSVTKTVTSVIIGIAINRKDFPDINTPILTFYDTSAVKNIDERKRRMTIKHLLTMTAGFDWNESISYDDPKNDCTRMEAMLDWIDYVINKPMSDEPGTKFNYNSGATQLLADIFRKATGMDIEEYAVAHLFQPLNIEDHFWKRSPGGLIDTEGGLYLSPPDIAKVFYLYLTNGMWNGKQLVSKQWVNESVTPYINVGGTTNYGYKWWLNSFGKDNSVPVWNGNGFGGQYPVIIPEYDMVVVFNGWNILEGKPGLRLGEAMQMILNAVEKK
jgi:CubicO group peptidase (beta-lactamase class C family)